MSDLETAAHEAATQLQPLIQSLSEAQRECQEAIHHLEGLGGRLTGDRRALHDIVDAMRKDAEQTEQMLSDQASDATTNLSRVAEAVDSAVKEWEKTLGREDAALTGGSRLLSELGQRVKDLAEAAEASSHATLEWANSVSQHLEEAVAAVEQVVGGGLRTMVADWKRQVEESVTRLVDYFEKDCEGLLNGREADWRSKVAQLHDLLDHAFEGIAPHEQEIASYTVEKWGQLMDAQLASSHKEAQALTDVLASLGQSAANYEGELKAASDMIGEQQQQAAQSAAKLEQGLFDTRGHWATYNITG
ncbi:MAG TPA: hypothetical protein VN461_14385 [Vicinamibacteria bacterium]|jgi:hypothetical protein|nr:hypothetical protein [Vicinamibacteria bacterium]